MSKSVAASILDAYPTIAEWASGGPVSPVRLADELRAALAFAEATSSPAPRRSASSPSLPGLSGGGDAVGQAASPEYDPEGEA